MLGLYHYIAFGLFAGFAAVDLVGGARAFPEVAHWRLKGLAFMLLYFAAATYAPLLWDGWLGKHRLFAADSLPLWAQMVGGFFLLEFGIYVWHRTMHNTPVLWRFFHQMRSEEHTSELQSRQYLVCRLLLEKKKKNHREPRIIELHRRERRGIGVAASNVESDILGRLATRGAQQRPLRAQVDER